MYARKVSKKYDKLRWKTMSGRQVEGEVLLKAAMLFRRAQGGLDGTCLNTEVEEALDFNRRIWDVLRRGWAEKDCPLPIEVRQNLLNLSVFMAKAELAFRAKPEGTALNSLIQVNETLAGGLGAQVPGPEKAEVSS